MSCVYWDNVSVINLERIIVRWELLWYCEVSDSGQLRVIKNLSVIERCPLLGDNLKKIVTFETKCFVRYWEVSL